MTIWYIIFIAIFIISDFYLLFIDDLIWLAHENLANRLRIISFVGLMLSFLCLFALKYVQ